MIEKDTLKPCPFCGATPNLLIRNRQYTIVCSNHRCIAHDIEPHYRIDSAAVTAWNSRKKEVL